jgi:L1 cell adhesion molecule like protein
MSIYYIGLSENAETSPVPLTSKTDALLDKLGENFEEDEGPDSPATSSLEQSSEDIQLSSTTSSPSQTSSIDLHCFLGPKQPMPIGSLPTYKVVGDNINKQVKPRDMRSDHQTQSLHYFHAYAVRDRINLDEVDDSPSATDESSVNLELLLPTKEDEEGQS